MAQRSMLLLVAALSIASTAQATGPVGNEFQVNSFTLGGEFSPAVAAAAGGQLMAVWNRGEGARDGDGHGVFGRVFDNQGNPLGPDFQVNTYTLGSQVFPAVTGDAAVVGQAYSRAWALASETKAVGARFLAAMGLAVHYMTAARYEDARPFCDHLLTVSATSAPWLAPVALCWASFLSSADAWKKPASCSSGGLTWRARQASRVSTTSRE